MIHEVTYYQAQCDECRVIVDDDGDFSVWSDPGAAEDYVCDYLEWARVGDETPGPYELLCANCRPVEDDDVEQVDLVGVLQRSVDAARAADPEGFARGDRIAQQMTDEAASRGGLPVFHLDPSEEGIWNA